MRSVEKGSYGYIEYRKKSQIIITGIIMAIVAAIFLGGFFITGTKNNICTVLAVLGVLPAARYMVSYLVVCKYNSPSKDRWMTLSDKCSGYILYSDCAMSCKDKTIYVEFAAITDNVIYCYTGNDKFDVSYFESGVSEFIKSCGDTVEVKLYKDFDSFNKRISELSNIEFKQNKLERVAKDFKILLL